MPDARRMIRNGLVQIAAVDRTIELGVVVHVARDPILGRSSGGLLAQYRLHLFDGPEIHVHAGELTDSTRMAVRVDESRNYRHPFGVEHLGTARYETPHVGGAAHAHKAAVPYGERFSARECIVDGVHTGVENHEILNGLLPDLMTPGTGDPGTPMPEVHTEHRTEGCARFQELTTGVGHGTLVHAFPTLHQIHVEGRLLESPLIFSPRGPPVTVGVAAVENRLGQLLNFLRCFRGHRRVVRGLDLRAEFHNAFRPLHDIVRTRSDMIGMEFHVVRSTIGVRRQTNVGRGTRGSFDHAVALAGTRWLDAGVDRVQHMPDVRLHRPQAACSRG